MGCLLVFTSVTFASTQTVTTYKQLLNTLQQGKGVKAIVYLDQCTPRTKMQNNMDEENTFTGFNIDIFSHYKVKINDQQERFALATSKTILTEHRTFGPVYAYERLRLFDDNSAEYHTAFYDPKTYELKGSMDYSCSLNNNSIVLYMNHALCNSSTTC